MTANTELIGVREAAWRRGLVQLWRGEWRGWWRTSRWWVNALLWPGILAGLTGLVLFVLPSMAETIQSPDVAAEGGPVPFALMLGRSIFFEMGTMIIAMGVIILTQESIIQELDNGVAEWLLSKPVQRRAYVMAKALIHLVPLVFMLLVPGLLVYGLFSLRVGMWFPVQPFLGAVGLLAVHSFFYLALTVLLSVKHSSRPVVLAVTLGSLFGGSLVLMVLRPLMYITPWTIAKTASAVVQGAEMPGTLVWGPAAGSLLLGLIFLILAQAVMQRREF